MFEINCEHCRSRYLLPDELREPLRGSIATCAWCMREWTPLPSDDRGLLAAQRSAGAGTPPIALHLYLQKSMYDGAPPVAPANPLARSTTQMHRVPGANVSSLRVAASGPEFEFKAVFDLGPRKFLIGRRGCHLDLPLASALPERAIGVRSADNGFQFDGIGGFLIPIGSVSVAAGRIEAGARLDLVLGPYKIVLEPSSTPGQPIVDLEAEPKRTLPPPAAAAPAGDMSQTVRGLAAPGFDSRRVSNPTEGLDVGFLGLDPPVRGETFWIKKSPTLIGRTSGDIVLSDSRVSGKHAQIDILALDQYSIKDLASTNGTAVNDRPAATARLKDGDVVSFGGVRLQFIARPKKRKE